MIAWIQRRWDVWSVRFVALLTGLMGVINVLSAVTPSFADRLELLRQFLPLTVRQGSRLAAALAGFALLMLAENLWRRKRMAWALSLVVLIVSIPSHLLKGLNYEEAGLAAALALWLMFLRPHFHARSDPPSIRQGVRALIAALLFTLAYGVAGFYLMDQRMGVRFGWRSALEQTAIMLTQFYDPGLEPVTRFGRYLAGSIYVIGGATLSYALVMLFRPVLVRRPALADERARAEKIVQVHGRTALARFALFQDKSYYFSCGGSALAYVVRGRVAFVLGDPIGPPADVPAAIAEFQRYCADNDWLPAFYQTLPDHLEHYRAAGFDIVCIGHQAIVVPAGFSMEGKANKGLRSGVTKLVRLGHRAQLYEPPLPDGVLRELRLVSDEWLAMMNGVEMHYSLGAFEDDYVRRTPVMVIRTPDGRISAFATLVTEYRHNGISVDLMRRRRQVENGTMDFLFVKIIEWAQEQGYVTFDLGLSALAGVGEDSDDPAVEKALHYIYEHIYQFYNFKGLHAFKNKFHPEWSPRYLVYPGAASLPSVALALIRADAGIDLTWDDLKGRLRKRRRHSGRHEGDEMMRISQPGEAQETSG